MDKIKVIILEGGKTAKEINPMKKPASGKTGYGEKFAEWKRLEDNLRTLEIEFEDLFKMFAKIEEKLGGKIQHAAFGHTVGEIRKAEILPSGQIKIL